MSNDLVGSIAELVEASRTQVDTGMLVELVEASRTQMDVGMIALLVEASLPSGRKYGPAVQSM